MVVVWAVARFRSAPIRSIPAGMTASTDAAPRVASQAVVGRYYLAMSVPFAIDVITLLVYGVMPREFALLPVNMAMSAAFIRVVRSTPWLGQSATPIEAPI